MHTEAALTLPTTLAPIRFRDAGPADRDAVIALWEVCGLTRPWNDATSDFDFALAGPASTVLGGEINGRIAASVMVGHDGHRGAVYYLSVDPALRGAGYGRASMMAAEQWLKARSVPKINLMVRGGNEAVLGFYQAIGYAVEANTQLGKRLDGRD